MLQQDIPVQAENCAFGAVRAILELGDTHKDIWCFNYW